MILMISDAILCVNMYTFKEKKKYYNDDIFESISTLDKVSNSLYYDKKKTFFQLRTLVLVKRMKDEKIKNTKKSTVFFSFFKNPFLYTAFFKNKVKV